jgi:hypothetical protein
MRSTVIAISLGLALPMAGPSQPARAATEAIETLAEQLKTGLKVQASDDVAFCDEVARLVRIGRLPARVVDGTYTWAIRRGRKYPFPAFAAALRIKADRLGVRLP